MQLSARWGCSMAQDVLITERDIEYLSSVEAGVVDYGRGYRLIDDRTIKVDARTLNRLFRMDLIELRTFVHRLGNRTELYLTAKGEEILRTREAKEFAGLEEV